MFTQYQTQAQELVDEALLGLEPQHDLLEADARPRSVRQPAGAGGTHRGRASRHGHLGLRFEQRRGHLGAAERRALRTRPGLRARSPGRTEFAARLGVDRPGFAITVGETASRLIAARTTLFATADGLDHTVSTAGALSPQQLVSARLTLSRVARDAADVAHEISLVAGSRGCLEQNDVGRLWRDTHTAARHAALAPAVGFDMGGRAEIDPSAIDAAAAAGPLAPANASGST